MADNTTLNVGTGGDIIATDDVAGTKHQLVKVEFGAADAATMVSPADPLPVVQTGALPAGDNNVGNVDVLTVPAPLSTTGGGTEAAALRVTLANDSTGLVSVDDNGGSLTVDNAALAVTGGGVEAGALRVTLANDSTGLVSVDGTVAVSSLPASTNTLEVVGDVAHDAGIAGNPVTIGGVSETPDDSAPANQVSAEAEATRFACDRDGALYTHPHPPRIWHVAAEQTAQQTDTSVKAAPGAGLSLYITDIKLSCNGAVTVTFEEGTTTLKYRYYAGAAGDGSNVEFKVPVKLSANTALTVTTSAAVTVSYTVCGYTAP